MIPLTTGFLSWCFHYTAAIHNGEVCGYNWGILHDRLVLVFAFPCQLQPPCTFTTALCVANTQHCRCEIQYRTDSMATALHPMCYQTLSLVQCLLSFHDRISPGLHFHTLIHDPWFFSSHTEHNIPLSPSLVHSFANACSFQLFFS